MLAELFTGRFTPKQTGQSPLSGTSLASLRTAQVEPLCAEGSRSGRRFLLGNSAAITGIAPVQTLPTTAAQWVLWNADPSRAYFFEELGVYLTSGTPGVGGVLLAALLQTPALAGVSNAGIAVSSASNGGLTSKMIVKASIAFTQPAAPNWYPVASNPSPNVTAFAGSTFLEHRSLQGRIVVPPNQGLALAVVAPAGTTPLFAPFAQWFESETDLE